VQRAIVENVVRTMTMMMMYVEIEFFHRSCCCSGKESGGKRHSGGGEVSLSGIGSSGIGSGRRFEAKRHLFLGPVDARAERDD